jgi:ABC-type proline/glycine betaine transport system permease subunit
MSISISISIFISISISILLYKAAKNWRYLFLSFSLIFHLTKIPSIGLFILIFNSIDGDDRVHSFVSLSISFLKSLKT